MGRKKPYRFGAKSLDFRDPRSQKIEHRGDFLPPSSSVCYSLRGSVILHSTTEDLTDENKNEKKVKRDKKKPCCDAYWVTVSQHYLVRHKKRVCRGIRSKYQVWVKFSHNFLVFAK